MAATAGAVLETGDRHASERLLQVVVHVDDVGRDVRSELGSLGPDHGELSIDHRFLLGDLRQRSLRRLVEDGAAGGELHHAGLQRLRVLHELDDLVLDR
ncbi:MAG: hypothetical protein HYX32_14675 [Actinobacteria bacterium]|nr:hypothetical protein [Actinomycetota bacterium]